MKIHLPNYYSRLIEKGTIIIIILKEKFIIIIFASRRRYKWSVCQWKETVERGQRNKEGKEKGNPRNYFCIYMYNNFSLRRRWSSVLILASSCGVRRNTLLSLVV